MSRNTSIAAKRQQLYFYTLLFGLFLLVALLATHYNRSFDVTTYQGNSLDKTSIQLLQRLQSPLAITAFVTHSAKNKKLIQRIISKYQAHADITLTFKNPNVAMDLVRQYDITHEGQLLLRYQDKTAIVNDLSETSITRGIYRVLQRQIRHIAFVSGHGEIYPNSDSDFSQLKKHLIDNQLKVLAANLSLTEKVPDNVDLLVIAAPQTSYADSEVRSIINYIRRGGQLLWLGDENSVAIPALSRLLAAKIQAATLLNQSGKPYRFKHSRYLAVQPKNNDFLPLQSIQSILALPNTSPVRLLATQEADAWQALPFLPVTDKSYLQQGNDISQLKETAIIGVQLSSKDLQQKQRAVLLGNVDFLRNEWLGQGENSTFAVQLFRYLSIPSDDFIMIETPQASAVIISKKTLAWLAIFFIIMLPIILLLLGKIVRKNI